MKPIWNSLLITLSLVLSTLTPALAEWPATQNTLLVEAKTETRPIPPTTDSSETTEADTSVEENTEEKADEATSEEPSTPETSAEETEEAETPEDAEEEETVEDPEEAAKKAERRRRLEILAEADRLHLAGEIAAAEELYRQVKPSFSENGEPGQAIASLPDPTTDPEQLSPASKVYWREGQAGWEQKLESRIFVPLEFLVKESPEFIPGHVLLAEAYTAYEQPEKAVDVLERATTLYPNEPELLRAKITTLANTEQWLEASISARQFAVLNPDRPDAEEFARLADENFDKFRSQIRKQIAGNAIGNVVTGALTVAITGNPLGAISAVDTLIMLARGESSIGKSIAEDAREQLEMVEDEEVVAYVNELGQKLAKLTGRDDFEYEFYVIKDKHLNAFALPGGKVFVNAGAILYTDSEAELAGLLTHELAHAVLSHGFQMVTHGRLLGGVAPYMPFGGTIANLLVLDYSRDMERQADVLGTRLLTSAGYAADGLRNLMVQLKEQYGEGSPALDFLSSHPAPKERIQYLETLIQRGGYNRFTYEGVDRHQEIRKRVAKIMKDELDKEELKKLDIDLSELETEADTSEESQTDAESTESEGEESQTDVEETPSEADTSEESQTDAESTESEVEESQTDAEPTESEVEETTPEN